MKGALRRDENNIVYNIDQYTQGTWDFADAWSATLGVRRSEVNFDSQDHFVATGNKDDSGNIEYQRHLARRRPRFSRRSRGCICMRRTARASRRRSSPSSAYRSDGGTGLNLAARRAQPQQ